MTRDYCARCLLQIGGDTQVFGEVIKRAERYDAERGVGVHERARHRAHRAVAAGRDDEPCAGSHGLAREARQIAT